MATKAVIWTIYFSRLLLNLKDSRHGFATFHLSVMLSPPGFLNHWAEFSQTCYITFPHCKGVQEQHYFLVCRSSVRLFVTLSLKPQGGIQPTLLTLMVRVCESKIIFPSVRRPSIRLSSKSLGRIEPNLLHDLPS